MTWDKCTEEVSHPKIRLEDKGSKRFAIFLNPTCAKHSRTRTDGCLVVEQTAADWVLTCDKADQQVIVELKGKNVEHAAKQIFATAAHLKQTDRSKSAIAGLIVCTQYPKHDTKIARAKLKFAREYGGPIHAASGSREFHLDRLVRF